MKVRNPNGKTSKEDKTAQESSSCSLALIIPSKAPDIEHSSRSTSPQANITTVLSRLPSNLSVSTNNPVSLEVTDISSLSESQSKLLDTQSSNNSLPNSSTKTARSSDRPNIEQFSRISKRSRQSDKKKSHTKSQAQKQALNQSCGRMKIKSNGKMVNPAGRGETKKGSPKRDDDPLQESACSDEPDNGALMTRQCALYQLAGLPHDALPPFDWQGLEARYHSVIQQKFDDEERLKKEFALLSTVCLFSICVSE